jgi:4-hydroxybenzoyl-CoA reductase subunit beta
MLRLPPYSYHRPATVREAVETLARHSGDAMPIAGGTDLVPNMKHGLFSPGHLVALKGIREMRGITIEEAGERSGGHAQRDTGSPGSAAERKLVIGAGETLTAVATNPLVRLHVPALSRAAAHIAGPQHRNVGTIGGNLCLDTRCTYYNQSEFWRGALGYCLKKDGTTCHVTRVGAKCVAAHSADTPPVLMTVDAEVEIIGPEGERLVPVRDFFVADGIWNTVRSPDEVITRIRIPLPAADRDDGPGHVRSGYAKLRQRNSIDFPLLTIAVAGRMTSAGKVHELRGVVTALGSRPRELGRWEEIAVGRELTADVIEALGERAHRQCTPLENHIVDPEWRKAMVPTIMKRALEDLLRSGPGPVSPTIPFPSYG